MNIIKKTFIVAGLITGLSAIVGGTSSFAQDEEPAKKNGTIYMVADAHFDSQWLWDVHTSIDQYVRNTLTQNLYLMDNYPDYIFNFEGAVKYEWMKEYYPLLFERAKQYIQAGRWHISGASYDATDTNMPSPESFFRNILLGQDFYKHEFGLKSTDIFLPDCFGFGYTLPTIASHCGLLGFSTQKLNWRNVGFYEGGAKIPFPFGVWEGIDGSRIFAYFDGRDYGHRYDNVDIFQDKEIKEIVDKAIDHTAMRYFGTGDTGGSPTIGSVEAIEKAMVDGNGPFTVKFGTSDDIFKKYYPASEHPNLPVYNGELLMDRHGTGCYTSQAAMKYFNRANERLGDAAERASVIAEWLGGSPYPRYELTTAWKRFIWHQFHDDLTGTSIPPVYKVSWNDEILSETQFTDILTSASREVASGLNTKVSGTPVVVFNSLAFPRKDQVKATVPMDKKPKGVYAVSPSGKKLPAQLLSWNDGKAEIVFDADVPSLSYSVYNIKSGSASSSKNLKHGDNWIENRIYKVQLDENGDMSSIIDKRNGKELVENGKAFRLAVIHGNKSTDWPAWEILKETDDKPSEAITEDVRIEALDAGPARVAIKVTKKMGESNFVQTISLTDGAADDRIEVLLEIDWAQKDALLKEEFPMSVSSKEATYDLGLGTVRRGNNTIKAYEVPAYQWADITSDDGSYGISIIPDYKVGWDKPNDNTLRLTLIHTPRTKNGDSHYDVQDIGSHIIRYAIVGHAGNYVDAGIPRKADEANNRLYAFNSSKHEGSLGKELSFMSVDSENLDLKALKKSEEDESYVVRFYENAGKSVDDAAVNFAATVEDAYAANGIEEKSGEAKIGGKSLFVSTTKFSPKTYSVTLGAPQKTINPEEFREVELPFNGNGFSNDAFLGIGNIDGKGNSYSYDILPEMVVSGGVPFTFGELNQRNVLRCDGDSLIVDNSEGFRNLYLLVASTSEDKVAAFQNGGESYEYEIPYYSGYYGQWGWKGTTGDGFVKNLPVAYVGTHRHNSAKGNESYTFTYMFRIAIPLTQGVNEIRLPKDREIVIFSATMSDADDASFTPADEFRSLPKEGYAKK
jgi:alpha-mannosidase